MRASTIARRFLLFGPIVTILCYAKFRSFVSPKAEVELSANLAIGTSTRVGSYCKIKTSAGKCTVGSNVQIATGCFISSDAGGLTIGNDVQIGPHCSIICNSYRHGRLDVPIRRQGSTSQGVVIGDDVLLGAGVVVLDGTEIGRGAVVSANSVVSGKFPERVVISGNPARIVFKRR